MELPDAHLPEAEYGRLARAEMFAWRAEMQKPPGAFDKAARGVQDRINRAIPEKVHQVVTAMIENVTRGILTGSDWTTPPPVTGEPLSVCEQRLAKKVELYRNTAAVEGGVAGAGGFVLAAVEFPVLLTTKLKLLFDMAALYGHDTRSFAERLYILSIFQLAFSSPQHRREVFDGLAGWDERQHPQSFEQFDWRRFQQQYRDYLDLAKLAQLLPVVGAPIGVVVNYRLLNRLARTGVGAYRMRWFSA